MAKQQGFGFIELLIVIGILTVLFTVILISINPARKLAQKNNTKRVADVQTILDALYDYKKTSGEFPKGLTKEKNNIGSLENDLNLCFELVPQFLSQIPTDPVSGHWVSCENYDSGYSVRYLENGVVSVTAPDSELSKDISATRFD